MELPYQSTPLNDPAVIPDELVVGSRFGCFEDFKVALKKHSARVMAVYNIDDSKTVKNVNKRLEVPYPLELKYKFAKFVCKHYGALRPSGKGIRPNQKTSKSGCPSSISIRANKSTSTLVVTNIVAEHNHNLSKEQFSLYPEVRKLCDSKVKVVGDVIELNVKTSILQDVTRNSTLKSVTAKDLDNLSMEGQTILQKIGFIGAGNMAQAIGQGLINSGIVHPSQIIASAPSDNSLAVWRGWGVKTTKTNGEVVLFADIVFLAVKPHLLDKALEGLMDNTQVKSIDDKLYVSILAGTTCQDLHTKLTKAMKHYWNDTHRIVRTMVNTPMMVGVGCSVFCCGTNANKCDQDTITKILSSRGMCQMVPESLINAVGGLSGSGPAYAYLIIEALSDGAVKQGLPREMATKFAAQTLIGAAKMVLETGKHCGQLKDEVCSPGGSTIAGIHALERAGLRSALMDAVEAAVKRSEEMGKKT